jgi:hypothetical protein
MKLISVLVCCSVILRTAPFGFGLGEPDRAYPAVGPTRLAANPSDFDGKGIQTTGWLKVIHGLERSSYVLFLTIEGLEYNDTIEAVSLEATSLEKLLDRPRDTWLILDRERVRIQGQFVASKVPVGNGGSGTLGELRKITYFVQEKPGAPIFGAK